MNAPTSTSPAPQGGTATGHAQGNQAPARGAGRPAGGTDLFANLLSLLSAGSDLAVDTLATPADSHAETHPDGGTDPAQTMAQGATHNPLAALLGWSAAPMPQTPSDAGGALARLASENRLSMPLDLAAPSYPPEGTGPTSDIPGVVPAHPLSALAASDISTETLGSEALATSTRWDASAATLATPATTATAAATNRKLGTSSVRITAWRSTTGLAPNSSGTAGGAMSHSLLSQSTPSQLSLSRAGLAGGAPTLSGQGRSTVRLGDRFTPSRADSLDTVVTNTGHTGLARPEAPPNNAATGSPAASSNESGLSTDLAQGSSASGEDSPTSDANMPPAAEAEETVTSWNAQTLRHASVRVGEPGDQALDIQLSMAGQQVRVAFQTDDAQIRASLAEDAGATLGELLQRSGIDLSEVSVGAQSQQAGHDLPNRTPQGPWVPPPQRGRTAESPTDAANTEAPPTRPRADGSRPLDLFV